MEQAVEKYWQAYYMIPCRLEALYNLLKIYEELDVAKAFEVLDLIKRQKLSKENGRVVQMKNEIRAIQKRMNALPKEEISSTVLQSAL